MNTKQLCFAVLAIGLALAPRGSAGQTTPAESSGTAKPETQNSAPAIPPENQATREQVTRLFEAMRVREPAMLASQGMLIRLRQQMWNAAGNDNSKLPQEQRLAIAKLLKEYTAKAENVYPVDEMLADLSTIYQRYLTRDDADATIAFYTSKAGQDLLNAEPRIGGEAMPMVQQRAKEKGDALTAELTKELAAIKQQPATSGTLPAKQQSTPSSTQSAKQQ
jgi:hypothetical protein